MRSRASIVTAVLLIVGGVVAYAATIPSNQSSVSAILAEATINNAGAQGAPQQSVAAQWATRDLVALETTQQAALLNRLALLLLLILIGVVVLLLRPTAVTPVVPTSPGMAPDGDPISA